jgi:hypothetical protein
MRVQRQAVVLTKLQNSFAHAGELDCRSLVRISGAPRLLTSQTGNIGAALVHIREKPFEKHR